MLKALVVAVALAAASGAAWSPQRAMFGYEVGEQRRYRLGPPEALRVDESAEWDITLASIVEQDGHRFAVFELGYVWRWSNGPFDYYRAVAGRVVVNEHGFPGGVWIDQGRSEASISQAYEFRENERYAGTVQWPGDSRDFELLLPSHAGLDIEGQQGLWVFWTGEDLRGRRTGGSTDSVFANPGLLSLTLPTPLPDEPWDRDVLLLSPSDNMPLAPGGFLPRRIDLTNTFFSRNRLELGGMEQVEISGRTVEAAKLRLQGAFDEAWVDRNGRVLRFGDESAYGLRPRHIEIVWPGS